MRSDFEAFKLQLESILHEIDIVKQEIAMGNETLWTMQQLVDIIEPEVEELYKYANKGKIFFKYGKKQRMLVSSYCLTDSQLSLNLTKLGIKIIELQNLYNGL